MRITKLEHLGIAVRSADEAERLYAGVLGLPVVDRETLEDRRLKVVKVGVGETVLELLEPLDGEEVIRKFLDARGPGIHHVCFEVENLHEAVAYLRREGYEPLSDPKPGAGGRLVVFLRPKQTLGVLIELNQPVKPEP